MGMGRSHTTGNTRGMNYYCCKPRLVGHIRPLSWSDGAGPQPNGSPSEMLTIRYGFGHLILAHPNLRRMRG